MREKILAEAEKLLWKFGVKSVTMDDIARQVGISKKTIYQHFADKDDIVLQVMRSHLERDQNDMTCRAIDSADPIQELLNVSEVMRQKNHEVNPSTLFDIQRHYPKAWAVFLNFKEKYIITSISQNLKTGIERGLYRSDLDVDVMARLRIESIQLGFDDRVFPDTRDNMLVIQEQLLHHFIRGLLTEKGFALYNQYNQYISREEPVQPNT